MNTLILITAAFVFGVCFGVFPLRNVLWSGSKRYQKWLTMSGPDDSEFLKRFKELEAENITMYAAILEAANLGTNAAGRCILELQRIARNDSLKGARNV
jgi:hypothetical protein